MYLGKVYVSYKPSVLDPQGTVIQNKLGQLGFADVDSVKQGKYFEIKLKADTKQDAATQLEELTQALLINPNTETYRYDLEEVSA
ncbi:phosphoribosylformylglycinamidine synthase subunit PurS [Fructilactobacillus cliffordii]|uniref:Phosphoribosylformylglycinamidine synthase subunit PurS n=1 Tax=Fructilactobacillus cliffordii TaxID=2940299 RepID=A0A9Q8ZTG2_9LACO|nr:phosphoribosylformylglycinamidine synthase subunit PurS [Fructilactobacillus cliffordii]USS89309.1 phosphoribosylformylglycinamidine synthase subunit PurS [Fructilactobacillus cliffordii]